MRILIYVPTLILDSESAGATHIRELAQNLSRLGNQVTIICRLRNNACENVASIKIKRLKLFEVKVIGFIFSTIYGLFRGILTTCKEEYDLIYTRSGLSASACFIASLGGLPYLTEVSGLIHTEVKISWVGWWRKAAGYVMSWIESKAFRRSNHLIAVTLKIKDALVTDIGLEPGKITVIPNAANIDLFKPVDSKEARKQLNLTEVSHIVVLVGYLVAWQGVSYLIKSVPHVLQKCPNTAFLIIGDGPLKRELLQLVKATTASGEVIFTGLVPNKNLPPYVNSSDICVACVRPMRSGYSPLKLYEYMACGKPVVATRTSGFEILEENNAGLLVNPENSEELADAIIKLLKDPELRKRMGENARKYVVQNHSWESVAKRVAEVCEQTFQEYRKKRNKRKL